MYVAFIFCSKIIAVLEFLQTQHKGIDKIVSLLPPAKIYQVWRD